MNGREYDKTTADILLRNGIIALIVGLTLYGSYKAATYDYWGDNKPLTGEEQTLQALFDTSCQLLLVQAGTRDQMTSLLRPQRNLLTQAFIDRQMAEFERAMETSAALLEEAASLLEELPTPWFGTSYPELRLAFDQTKNARPFLRTTLSELQRIAQDQLGDNPPEYPESAALEVSYRFADAQHASRALPDAMYTIVMEDDIYSTACPRSPAMPAVPADTF